MSVIHSTMRDDLVFTFLPPKQHNDNHNKERLMTTNISTGLQNGYPSYFQKPFGGCKQLRKDHATSRRCWMKPRNVRAAHFLPQQGVTIQKPTATGYPFEFLLFFFTHPHDPLNQHVCSTLDPDDYQSVQSTFYQPPQHNGWMRMMDGWIGLSRID